MSDTDKRSETPTSIEEEDDDFDPDEANNQIEALFGCSTDAASTLEGEEETKKTSKKKKKGGGISFGEVRVREHERVFARRTSKVHGLAIGWNHHGSAHFVLDEYEQKKIDEHHHQGALKNKEKVKTYERMKVLSEYGYSSKEVLKAERERQLAKIRLDQGLPDLEPDSSKEKKGSAMGSPRHLVKGLFSGFGKKKKEAAPPAA